MRIGVSLFLIAMGAILKFAVTDSVKSVSLGVVGIILMIVGVVGLIAELILWSTRRRHTTIYEAPVVHDPYVPVPVPLRCRRASSCPGSCSVLPATVLAGLSSAGGIAELKPAA